MITDQPGLIDETALLRYFGQDLEKADCGACGEAGCRAFAEKVVDGSVAPAKCTVMGDDDREEVAAYLGVEAGAADKVVAVVAGGGQQPAIGMKGHALNPRSMSL